MLEVQGTRDGGCSPSCEMMMMAKGQQVMPWVMAVGGIASGQVVLALLLLVVLEVLWIVHWVRRLKARLERSPT